MRPARCRADHEDMTTFTTPPVTRRRLLASVLLGCCVALTLPTGLVVGWFATELQFFGAQPSAEDHAMAAGAYGAGAAALLLGALALRAHGTTRWQVPVALAAAGLLTYLAVSSAVDATTSSDPGPGTDHWWDGAGAVLVCPWTWPLVLLGLLAPLRRSPQPQPPLRDGGGWG